jgi:hypothetical protein
MDEVERQGLSVAPDDLDAIVCTENLVPTVLMMKSALDGR